MRLVFKLLFAMLLVSVGPLLFAGITAVEGLLLVPPTARVFVMVGIFGGFTTFSSFSLQTLNLVQDGEWLAAGGNVVFSVVLCLGAHFRP